MSTANSTTVRLADVNWSRFVAEAEALARTIEASTPGITAREAGDCAAQQVEAAYAAELVAQASQPTTYAVSALLDKLVAAVDVARTANTSPRWQNAINAGFDHLLQAEVIEVDSHNALIYRSESGATYRANGVCQCRAFAQGQPCKHRAAARLVMNALHAA